MEVIKKIFKQAVTTGTTTGTTENEFVIIPDTGVSYNMKFSLHQDIKDMGFFDTYPDDDVSGVTGNTFFSDPYNVSGFTSSRLHEVRKYKVTNVFEEKYWSGGAFQNNGVDYGNSVSGETITYYIDGIRYNDEYSGETYLETTFFFLSDGYNSPAFTNKRIYKDPNKMDVISKPKISDDVFIIRQELSAFEKNYALEYVKNLGELVTYAGGKYFNVSRND